MAMSRAFIAAAALAVFLAGVPAAHAGRSCKEAPLAPQVLQSGMALAARTQAALEASGARVVVLARAGQDLQKYGVRYSHLGFAYRTGSGEWRVLHKLNECGTARADVYRQGLAEFFLDDLWRHEAAWAVLSEDLQERLLPVLRDDAQVTRLHDQPYSIVSYAWGQKYQQSNQWAIETLAFAVDPSAASRERAQDWLWMKGYVPTALRLGPLTRLGGRITSANVAFDDHPDSKRFADRIETVTVDSVFDWLQRSGMADAPVVVRP